MFRPIRLLLAGVLCTLTFAFLNAAAPAQPPIIEEVSWHEFGLVVRASAPLDPEIFTLENPWRFVVDLPGAEFADTKLAQTISLDQHGLKRVRMAQRGDNRVRMVVDCNGPVKMQLIQIANRSTLVLAPAGKPNAKLAELLEVRSDYTGGPQEIEQITAHSAGNQLKLRLKSTRSLTYALAEPGDTHLQVRVPRGHLAGAALAPGGLIRQAQSKTSLDGTWMLDVKLIDGLYNLTEQREADGVTLVWERIPPRRFPNRPLVVVDAGHGGPDPGAIGPAGAREKDVTLALAKALERTLLARRFNVVLTRNADTEVLLAPRLAMIDRHRANLFVSLHANSHTAPDSHGIETYWRQPQSRALATAVQQHVTELLKRSNRGVKQERLYVLRHPSVPSILLESGFISNPHEEKLLGDSTYQGQAASAIVAGIEQFMAKPPLALAP